MAYRKCSVCSGSGILWGTPPFITTQLSNQVDNKNDSLNRDEGHTSYGLEVRCWQCNGKGSMVDQPKDPGASNG